MNMKMRRMLSLLFASAVLLALAAPVFAQDQESQETPAQESAEHKMGKMGKDRTYTGEIMDAACAKMGSHKMMMKKEGTTDAKECSDKCVQAGSKYVLYNSATKRTYQLDDQDKAKELSGQKVKVTGSYNRKTKTIHVESMEAAS